MAPTTLEQVLGSLKGQYQWAQDDSAMLLGWSMTKSILNALVGIRVRQGEMKLDQSALLPEWCEQPLDQRCNITVLQLLQMSSGLYFDETYGAFSGATRMLFANTDIAKFATHHKYDEGTVLFQSCLCFMVLSAPRTLTVYAAGKRFYYSSATTNILTLILRNSFADPVDFANFPRKELCARPRPPSLPVMFSMFLMLFRFEPLGMSSALIQTDSKGLFVMSSFGQVVIPAYFTSTILVIRCRYANICDWVSFGALYARNGRTLSGRQILTEEWIAMTTAPNEFAEFGERC